jgi:hypothetical protein
MKKIADIVQEYKLTKQEVLDLLEKVTGKKYSSSTSRI